MINKKKNSLLLLLLLPLISVVFIVIKINESKRVSTTSSGQIIPLKDIVPGKSTKEEVIQSLGSPISSASGVWQYKSTSPARNNEINIKDEKVDFIKEIVSYKDTATFKEMTSKYGESNFLYGSDSVNGYYLYYNVDQGIAFLANPISDTVLEVWHFPPTTAENFKNSWAKDYSTTPKPGQF